MLVVLVLVGSGLDLSFLLLPYLNDLELLDVLQREVVVASLFEVIVFDLNRRQLLFLLGHPLFTLVIGQRGHTRRCSLGIVGGSGNKWLREVDSCALCLRFKFFFNR